jgi:hypothetical protein
MNRNGTPDRQSVDSEGRHVREELAYCQHVPTPLKAGDRVSIIFPAGVVKEKELVNWTVQLFTQW